MGSELVFALCELPGIEIVIIHKGDRRFEEELAQDVLEMITVFSARLYGSRSKKHKQLMKELSAEGDKLFGESQKNVELQD